MALQEAPPSPKSEDACVHSVEEDDVLSLSSFATLSTKTEPSSTLDEQRSWVIRSQILRGITLQGLADGRGRTISFSSRYVSIPLASISVEEVPVTDVIITSTTSPTESALLHLGFAQAAARRAGPWVSLVSGEPEPADSVPSIHVTCRRVYTRVIVRTEIEDLIPDPNFVLELEKTFTAAGEDDQIRALRGVLRRWGSVIATHVELGCSLTSVSVFEAAASIPSHGVLHDPHNPRALLAAERFVHNALRVRVNPGKEAPGSTAEDKLSHEDLSRQLSFKALGGTTKMHYDRTPDRQSMETPALWTVIGVDGIYPTLEIIRGRHPDLYERCQDLVRIIKEKTSPHAPRRSPPIFSFPGRLSAYKHGTNDWRHMTGSVDIDLPVAFDFYSEFSLSGWIFSGCSPNDTVAIGIECCEMPKPILQVGRWLQAAELQMIHHAPDVQSHRLTGRIQHETGKWCHIAMIHSPGRMMFYLCGELQATCNSITTTRTPLSGLRMIIGGSSWENKKCSQWDGAVENVHLWTRALSQEEISADAAVACMPRTAGNYDCPRYP